MTRVGDLMEKLEPFESCGVCSKDGWITVRASVRGNRPNEVVHEQKHCRCWIVWREKIARQVAALGTDRSKKK